METDVKSIRLDTRRMETALTSQQDTIKADIHSSVGASEKCLKATHRKVWMTLVVLICMRMNGL